MSIFGRGLFVFSALLLSSVLLADEAVVQTTTTPVSVPVSHQLYFSPQDKVDARLIALIESEKEDIRAAVYCLTHRGIIQALSDARKRGVNVEIIVDPFTIKARAPLKRMAQTGISLYIWDPQPVSSADEQEKSRKPLMHNKFCIFGKKSVWTGSFNFTSEASKSNQENVVVLQDPKAAERYLAEFERVKDDGCSPFHTYLAKKPVKKKKAKLF